MSRELCIRCFKAASVCVCKDIRVVDNRTGVYVLQHPREQFHPIGTVRFVQLGLKKARVWVDCERAPPSPMPEQLALLYPGPEARLLGELPPEERPKNLLVLDGTWAQAKSLYRKNPWLASLPKVMISPITESGYRIRKEPNAFSVSTVEAVVAALNILEPETAGVGGLLGAFDRMIDVQVEFSKLKSGRHRIRVRRNPSRALPELFSSTSARFVIAHGEHLDHHLVYWTAVRLDSGERFDALCRPLGLETSTPDIERRLRHIGVSFEQVLSGVSEAEMLKRWREFLRPDDALLVWNQSALDLAEESFRPLPPHAVMKHAYCNLRKGACGGAENVVEVEELVPETPVFLGRSGRVMACLSPIARFLLEQGKIKREPS
jgi:DTW domain-containing protein YfiP